MTVGGKTLVDRATHLARDELVGAALLELRCWSCFVPSVGNGEGMWRIAGGLIAFTGAGRLE